MLSCISGGKKPIQDNVVIATKFAAYPWRLTPAQFVNACKYALYNFDVSEVHIFYFTVSRSTTELFKQKNGTNLSPYGDREECHTFKEEQVMSFEETRFYSFQ